MRLFWLLDQANNFVFEVIYSAFKVVHFAFKVLILRLLVFILRSKVLMWFSSEFGLNLAPTPAGISGMGGRRGKRKA